MKNIISLGFHPLANALLTKEKISEFEEKFPLDLVFCEQCSLVQIIETVPPEKLFSEYFYSSSVSNTVLQNAKEITERLMERKKLVPYGQEGWSAVLEIGSNDGYLLKNYAEKGIKVIGIEPAENIAEEARKKGVHTITGFFNEKNAKFLSGVGSKEADSKNVGWNFHADIVHANNVIAHVADLHGVIEGIKLILAPDGVAVIETHYVRDLIEQGQFDCIYHEHLCYYSAHSLAHLFELHGMEMVDIERIAIHGGSIRAYFQLMDGPKSFAKEGMERVSQIFEEETAYGLTWLSFYESLMPAVMDLKTRLTKLLIDLKTKEKTIAVYGASAKSTTLLNFFGLDEQYIDFVVDDTPWKQGKYTPGTHLPIYPSSKLLEEKPDFALILTWNFAKEIMEKNQEFKNQGGKWIVPIPELTIL